MSKLNVSRRQDRLIMAGDIRAIVPRGWTITDERVGDDWRTAEMRPGPNANTRLARSFAPSVNQYHWHKATDVCEGFDDLLRTLKARMASAVDGTAFQ